MNNITKIPVNHKVGRQYTSRLACEEDYCRWT